MLFLDDDVVVQRDLTPLWSINLHGKVNGAMVICEVRFHHLSKYLNSSKFFPNGFDGNACAWMSGLNIIDLNVALSLFDSKIGIIFRGDLGHCLQV